MTDDGTLEKYGTGRADLIMIIDLPSSEIAERIFFQPEHLALIPLRDKVFTDFRMYVAVCGEIQPFIAADHAAASLRLNSSVVQLKSRHI